MGIMVVLLCASATPVYLCGVTIAQSVLLGVGVFFYLKDSWGVLMFVLVFFGGLLVLFMYVSVLAMNDTVTFNVGGGLVLWMVPVSGLDLCLLGSLSDTLEMETTTGCQMFQGGTSWMVLALIFYLLMSLVFIVKISSPECGSLRSV